MIISDGIKIIERTIQGERHEFYEECVEMAESCFSYMTGDDQDDVLELVRTRETVDQMKKRKDLFFSPTRAMLSPIENIYNKISLLSSEVVKGWTPISQNKQDLLSFNVSNTWENQDLESYLLDISKFYNFYDPNAFVLIEKQLEFDADKAVKSIRIYPVEFVSEQVVNYEIEFGRVKWAVFEVIKKEKQESGNSVDISYFYFYSAGIAVTYFEFDEVKPVNAQYYVDVEIGNKIRKFAVNEYPKTGSVECPVIRLGCYCDPETKNLTFVPPYWTAFLKLDESIRDKSFADVNIAEHYYPQKYALAPPCDYHDQVAGVRCTNGYIHYNQESKICPNCNGSGYNLHVSEQDQITIALPEDGINLPDLSKMLYWHLPPEWLPRYADERLAAAANDVFYLTFNTQLALKPAQTNTATGEMIDYESIQQKLAPYAKAISDNWVKYVRVATQYLEAYTADFRAYHQFPKDHKLQSLPELMASYQNAKQAGLAYPILQAIEDKILSKQMVDNRKAVDMYRAFRKFVPFKDKSDSVVARILANRNELDFERLLWENSDQIFRIVATISNMNLDAMEEDKQLQVIKDAVEQFKTEILLVPQQQTNQVQTPQLA